MSAMSLVEPERSDAAGEVSELWSPSVRDFSAGAPSATTARWRRGSLRRAVGTRRARRARRTPRGGAHRSF